MNEAQERALQQINKKWETEGWALQDDGTVIVNLSRGDQVLIETDGSWAGSWEWR